MTEHLPTRMRATLVALLVLTAVGAGVRWRDDAAAERARAQAMQREREDARRYNRHHGMPIHPSCLNSVSC